MPGIIALEVTPAAPIGWSDLSSIVTAITGQVSVANIVAILAGVIGITIGFVFFWWAFRKVKGMIMGAFKKGKL